MGKRELMMLEQELEIREATEAEPATISGYAIRFNTVTEIGGYFRELVRPEAVKDGIQGADIRALWNHNSDMPIGRTKNGTLSLVKDPQGLRFTVTPPDTSWGRDALESVKRGDVSGMSFGFYTNKERWTEEKDKTPLRELLDIELLEVSPVTFPAYPTTTAQARSAEDILATMPQKQPSNDVTIMRNRLKIKEMEV